MPELRHLVSIAQIQAADQELNDPIGQVVSGTGHIANALLEELLVPVKPGQKVAHVTTEPVMYFLTISIFNKFHINNYM